MSIFIETGQTMRAYVLAIKKPDQNLAEFYKSPEFKERVTSLVGRKVKSANTKEPKHGTIAGFATWNDADDFHIVWDDGQEVETTWSNSFVTLVEVL